MSCTVHLSIKDPQTVEGSSKLNQKFLEIFNDPIAGTNTSAKYLHYIKILPEFMKMPFYVEESHPDRNRFDKMLNLYQSRNLDSAFDEVTGEPRLIEASNGSFYFLNHKSERLYITDNIMSETQRVHLIKALSFSMIQNNNGLNPNLFIKKFFRDKASNNAARMEVIYTKLKNKDYLESEKASLTKERSTLIKQNTLIDSILNSNLLLNSIATGVSQEIKGVRLQYDQDLIKDELLNEEKDVSMGIENYTLASDEVRDDSTMDPEIFRIMNTIPDFYYDAAGNKIEKTEPLFGMMMNKSSNEVKNRILDVVNNIIETEFSDGRIEDAYTKMIESLNQHVIDYNDDTVKSFLEEVTRVYESKSDNDKLAFKVKFFKSFNKGTNNFILTEITKEKGTGSERFNLKRIVLKQSDPSIVQNKRSAVSQEFINTLVFTNSLNNELITKFSQYDSTHRFTKAEIKELLDMMNLYLNDSALDLLVVNQSDLSKIGDKSATPTFWEVMNNILSSNIKKHAITYDINKQYKTTVVEAIKGIRTGELTIIKRDSDEPVKIEVNDSDIKLLKLMMANELRNAPISILANAEALTRTTLSDSNYNIAGKSRWKYSNQSGINKLILKWQSGNIDDLLAIQHKNLPYVDYLLGNDLRKLAKNSEEDIKLSAEYRRKSLRLITNAQVREIGGNNAVEHKEILESDLMFDQMFKLKNLNDEMWTNTANLNDKSSAYYQLLEKTIATYNYSADKGGSFGIKGFDKVLSVVSMNDFIELFKGELATMEKHSRLIRDLDRLLPKQYDDAGNLIESRLRERQDYILQKFTPNVHYKTKIEETYLDEDGKKKKRTLHSFNPELLESDDNILAPELINAGEWSKFGFFNSFLQGNDIHFDALFETENGIKYINNKLENVYPRIDFKQKDGRSINDIIRDGIEALLEENYQYISNMLGKNLSNVTTNIDNSNTIDGIKNFTMTSILNNIQMFQMFNGDLGFFKQKGELLSMEDALKRGPAPMTDGLQFFNSSNLSPNNTNKATKTEDYFVSAAGNQVLYNPSTHAVVAVTKNIEFKSSKFDAQIEKVLAHRTDKRSLLPSYKAYKHEIADAGAYMTLEHYKVVKSKIYGWTDADEATFNNLMNPKYPPTDEDLHWLHLAGNTAQPVKLVGYEKKPILGEDSEVMYEMPIFLKYAPAVLVPSLVANTDVEKLMNTMKAQGVDQVVFKSGSKVANPGLTTIHNSENDRFNGLKDDMVLNPFTFSYSALKLQVELPSHFDSENTIGNQHVKNLLANLDLEDNRKIFPYKKEYLTAKQVYDKYSGTIVNILKKQAQNFLDKYGIEFDENNNINFNNPKLRDMLTSQLDVNADFQLINILRNNENPLESIPGAAQRLFPILAGFIHKKVGKIRTNTGSVIQVANIGFDRWNGNKNDVIYLNNDIELKPPLPVSILDLKPKELNKLEGINPEDLEVALEYRRLINLKNPTSEDLRQMETYKESGVGKSVYYYTDEMGNTIASVYPEREMMGVMTKGIMKINNAKVMMPFTSIQNKLNMSWDEFRTALEKSRKYWESDESYKAPIPEELFKNIISYRIPNQAISSNDAMEIVGILPSYSGDQAYVYNEITAKAGSDFDVDKLYLMLPSFTVQTGRIMEHLYNTYITVNEYGRRTFINETRNIMDMLNQIDPENDISYDMIYNELKAIEEAETNDKKYKRNIKLEDAISEVILNRTGDVNNELIENFVNDKDLQTKNVHYPTGDKSLKGLQNELIELMGSILKSEATYDDLMSPLDSDLVKDGMYEIGYENYLAEKGVNSKPKVNISNQLQSVANMSDFTNHSGGAIGSDSEWDSIGRSYGMIKNKHYYFEGFKTPKGNESIPVELKNEADEKLKNANKTLNRKFPTSNEYVNNLLRRNWWQVKNSDAIFAISTITNNKVDGGTGWAVHMAISKNKPVYVFDQSKNKWFTWNGSFIEINTPILTENFAGIGTREINQNGKKAINDVYEKTANLLNNRNNNIDEDSTEVSIDDTQETNEQSDIMTFDEYVKSKQVSPLAQISPMYLIKNRIEMLKAKKLVATMANHMTNVPIMQIQQMRFLNDIGLGDGDLGKIFMDDFKGYFSNQEYNDYTLKLTQIVSYFMNAAVDAAKDNYIIEGNFNSYTAGAAMLLVRSGMDPKEVFKLLLNPTVLKISNIKQSQTEITSNISLKNEDDTLSLDTQSLNEYSIEYMKFLKDNPKFKWNTSVDTLINGMQGDEKLIAGFWNVLVEAGKELNNEIAISKPDSAGAGKNLAEFSTLLVNLEKAAVGSIGKLDANGKRTTLNALYKNGVPFGSPVSTEFIPLNSSEINNLTFLGMMQNNSLFLTKKIAEGLFVEATPGYQYMLKHILKLTGNPLGFSETAVKDISKTLYGLVLANSNHQIYSTPSNSIDKTIEKTIESYNDLMKDPVLKENLFLKQLTINPLTNTLDFPNTKTYNKSDQSLLRDAFEQLYLSNDGNVSLAARRLMYYSYITSGFKPTSTSFNQFLPATYFIETGHPQAINNLIKMLSDRNNEASWKAIAESALIQSVVMNPRNYRNVVELTNNKIEFNEPVTDPESLAKLKTNANTFVPFVFQAIRTDKKNKDGNNIYSNHLAVLSGLSQNLQYPVYTELVLSGFDNDGIEKTTKYYDSMRFKDFDFYKTESPRFFETNNLSRLTDVMENSSAIAKDYYNYITPIEFFKKSLNQLSDAKTKIYEKILPLVNNNLSNNYNSDGIIDLINILEKTYGMSENKFLEIVENSDDDQLITDLQNAENCYLNK